MPSVDLTDDEIANLRWLLEAIGAGRASERIPYMANANSGAWAAAALSKLIAADGANLLPLKSNDQLRQDLGRFAADAKTQEEVDTLRALLAASQTALDAVNAKLDAVGVVSTRPGDAVDRIDLLSKRP